MQLASTFAEDDEFSQVVIKDLIDINTVDAFQGREKDIIIFSCVRAHDNISSGSGDNKGGIGFLQDIRRMNVGLTRAKFSLWIVGREASLRSSPPWSSFLDHCHDVHSVVQASRSDDLIEGLVPLVSYA